VNQVSQYLIEFVRPVNIATSSGKIIEKVLGGTLFYALTFMKIRPETCSSAWIPGGLMRE